MGLADIYVRNEDDPKFISTKIEETDRLEALISQIRLLFATKKGEVISEPKFGINIEDFLFDNVLDESTLKMQISQQYSNYIAEQFTDFSVEFDVNIVDTGVQQYGIIDILINGNKILELQV